ncbi:MAG: cytochrome c [Pseudomonadota bacterium]
MGLGAALAASGAMADAALVEKGRALFKEGAQPSCGICHALSDAGTEGAIGPNLDDLKPSMDQVRAATTQGVGVMPAFSETLSADDIEALAVYVTTVTAD